MKIKFVKLLSSILTIGIFMFFAFGSGENSSNSSTEISSDESVKEEKKSDPIEEECYKCNGFGKYTPKAPPGFVNKTRECEVCNGTGKLKN